MHHGCDLDGPADYDDGDFDIDVKNDLIRANAVSSFRSTPS